MDNMTADDLQKLGAKWMDRIKASEKRESQWMKDAAGAEAAYLCDDEADGQRPEYNILHSNVETIVPATYNSTPKPDIRPRHNNQDGAGKEVADLYERAIMAQIDDGRLDAEVEGVGQDGFMAGRGVIRVKFDADVEEQPAQMGMDPMTGEEVEIAPAQTLVTNERLIFENVSWRDYREGPAKRWTDVPWVAFRHTITQEEIERIRDDDMWTAQTRGEEFAEDDKDDETVWEVWDKATESVLFIIEADHKVIKHEDDPLGVEGFFPCTQPVQPITGTGKRTPVCPYRAYEVLARELDTITKRINAITKGLKVRGGIATGAEAIEDIADADDNTLVPIADLEGIAAVGGIDKAIMWWPIDKAITVLRELYVARDQTKASIYEITGISDIVRGASNNRETATAQQIKTQWGSLRIKHMQRLMERCVRGVFVISAEIMSRHFSPETLQQMAGMQLGPDALQMLQQPLNHYRIDVESDSTVRADLTQKRGEMAEFLQGTAQFFGTMAPLVQQTPTAAGPIAEMYAAFARQFSLGKQAEDAIDQLAEMAKEMAKQPQPNPEQEKMKAEFGLKQEELKLKAQEMQGKMQEIQGRAVLELENLKLTGQEKQANIELKAVDLQLKQRELGNSERQAEFDNAATVAELQIERVQKRAAAIGPT